jgi:TolB-like protein
MKKAIALAVIIAILAAVYFILSNTKGKPKKNNKRPGVVQSIAVLPFLNMSNDPGQEYFSDGLTDDILNSIAHLKGLKVCSRTSSFKFRGKNISIKDIGKQLGVNAVLEGSVQRKRIGFVSRCSSSNVEDEFHFWSEQYDEKLDNIFALQNKIADAIADKIRDRIA